jgi:hypothetical protein
MLPHADQSGKSMTERPSPVGTKRRSPKFRKEKNMNKYPLVWRLGFILLAFSPCLLRGSETWQEVRLKDEVVLIRPAAGVTDVHDLVFAAKGRLTSIRAATDLGEAGRTAVADITRYLPLACGGRVGVSAEAGSAHDYLLLLATARSEELLSWAGIGTSLPPLSDQECLIRPVGAFPDGTPGLVLIGGSPRGLLNGVYTLLERCAGIFWEPQRTLHARGTPESPLAETILDQRPQLAWSGGETVWKPAVRERIFYIGFGEATDQAVDWASRNRLSHLVIATPHELPLTQDQEKVLRNAVDRAHGLGMKVLFLNMTHRLPTALSSLKPSSPEAIQASTDLYVDLVSRFGLDGFAWHSASEGIDIAADKNYQLTPRAQWEARYFSAYYSAIRKIKKDALLVMLLGWVYMNPAAEMSALFPQDTVAWVVPNTPIIDAALTDLPNYDEHFRHVWYWLYVTVSADGVFPLVKLDYLETYFAQALKRGHGLAPQGVHGNNAANSMYFVQVARDGLMPHAAFLKSFGERYYGDPRMGDVLLDYQKALLQHRNWYNNVHTRDVKNYLTMEESSLLSSVFDGTVAAARDAKSPLVKDRLRVLAVTTLRCILRRSPHLRGPVDPLKDWTSAWMKTYGWNRQALEAMVRRFEEVFGRSEPQGGDDFFGEEFRKIQSDLESPADRNQ